MKKSREQIAKEVLKKYNYNFEEIVKNREDLDKINLMNFDFDFYLNYRKGDFIEYTDPKSKE